VRQKICMNDTCTFAHRFCWLVCERRLRVWLLWSENTIRSEKFRHSHQN
jgi:hypothetical protein